MKLWVIFMFVHKDTLVMNVLKYRVSKRAEQLVQYCVFCVYWPLSHSASLHHYASCLLSLFVTLLIFQSLITVASFPFFFLPILCSSFLHPPPFFSYFSFLSFHSVTVNLWWSISLLSSTSFLRSPLLQFFNLFPSLLLSHLFTPSLSFCFPPALVVLRYITGMLCRWFP